MGDEEVQGRVCLAQSLLVAGQAAGGSWHEGGADPDERRADPPGLPALQRGGRDPERFGDLAPAHPALHQGAGGIPVSLRVNLIVHARFPVRLRFR